MDGFPLFGGGRVAADRRRTEEQGGEGTENQLPLRDEGLAVVPFVDEETVQRFQGNACGVEGDPAAFGTEIGDEPALVFPVRGGASEESHPVGRGGAAGAEGVEPVP